MTPALTKRLRDARTDCTHIAAFTAGRTLDDYLTDVMLRSAVERQIEILGETLNQARRIDATLADRLPGFDSSPQRDPSRIPVDEQGNWSPIRA